MRFRFLILAASTLAVGCSHDFKAKVSSDTSWSGSFSSVTVDGNGDRTVDLDDEAPQCAVVQKQTRSGSLTVSIVDEGSSWFKTDGETKTTIADFGVVTACTVGE